MWKRITKCCIALAMVFYLTQPIAVQATEQTQGTSWDTAIDLTEGATQINGTTYFKYTNNTGSNVEIVLESSDCGDDDPYIEEYTLSSEGYKLKDDADDEDDTSNFKYTTIVNSGGTAYFRARAYGESAVTFQYTLNCSITALKDISKINKVVANPTTPLTRYVELDSYINLGGLKLQIAYTDGSTDVVEYEKTGDWSYSADKIKFDTPGTYPLTVYFSNGGNYFSIDLNYTVKSIIASNKATAATVGTKTTTAYSNGNWNVYTITPSTSGYYNLICETNSDVEICLYDKEDKNRIYYDNFYYDDMSRRNYLAAGHTYYVLVNVSKAGKSAKWTLINGSDANEEGITIDTIPVQTYTGKAITPKPKVYYNKKQISATDVRYYYYLNVNPGTAVLEIYYEFTDSGKWHEGSYYTTFKICKPIDKASVTVSNVAYTGKSVVPSVSVTLDGKKLTQDKDYKVIPDSNENAGTRTATIEGIGLYSGKITKNYTITKADQTITGDTEFIKDKKSKSFSLGAKAEGALTYSTSDKKVATVDAGGKVKVVNYGKAVITIKAAATDNKNAATKQVSVIVTSKATKISSVKSSAKKKASVKIAKASGAQGYEISYSTDKEFKNGVKKVTTKKTKATLKNLKSKKKYYVRVRSYRKVKGKTLYSTYSKVKTVKIK